MHRASHMYSALTAKRNALIKQLEAKVRRYKELQVKEMVYKTFHKPVPTIKNCTYLV